MCCGQPRQFVDGSGLVGGFEVGVETVGRHRRQPALGRGLAGPEIKGPGQFGVGCHL